MHGVAIYTTAVQFAERDVPVDVKVGLTAKTYCSTFVS